MSNQLKALQI